VKQGMTRKETKPKSIESIHEIFKNPCFSFPENLESSVGLLLTFESTSSIEYLVSLNSKVLQMHDSSEIWKKSLLSIIDGFVRFSYHPDVEIRHLSLSHLTRFCLDSKTLKLPKEWIISCFTSQLSILEELSKFDGKEFDETKLRSLNLFGKFYLNILNEISDSSEFEKLWKNVLKFMKLYSKNEILSEPVFELMKNMLLVMKAQDVWKEKVTLWEFTNQELQSFLPGILKEISTE
jgi:hypothetical protein